MKNTTQALHSVSPSMALQASLPSSSSSSFPKQFRNDKCYRNNLVSVSSSSSSYSFPPGSRRFKLSASSVSPPAVVSVGSKPLKLTYLEANGWLWDVGGVKLLVDPILVGNLDFGIPWLFDGAKKVLKNFKIDDLPELDCLVITQSLDDHCHIKTLKPLSEKLPNLPVISTPNARSILSPLFNNVTYLEPGEKSDVARKDGQQVNICATAGPVLGPPWQRPENGYIVKSDGTGLSLYYEPHCVFNATFLEKYKADVVITPVIKQLLPSFTLVSGQEDAIKLAKILEAKCIVPMRNGDLDAKGILASILSKEGTMEAFKEMLSREIPNAKLLEPTPGEPLEISLSVLS
ncbi:hypothetical protein LUZ60_012702 [Juncus effusus]|nr:hypothetical protein LUZ60_012702 [Juncus effusus]